jgi:hypothetical protein
MNIPNELVNVILSYREKHPISFIINNLINNCYKKDYNPYYAKFNTDNYCNYYTFKEWYFKLVRNKYNKHTIRKYYLTPLNLPIGSERFY